VSTSKLQRQVSALLSTHLGQYTIRENYRPEWLGGLELDFYIEELEVGIEVQGRQHFEYTPMFHASYGAFLEQKERDEQKATWQWHGDDKSRLQISDGVLDDDALWILFGEFTDGHCPKCGTDINQHETVCDDCLEQAVRYRTHGPPVDWR